MGRGFQSGPAHLLPGVRSASSRQLPMVRKPGVASLGHWVHVLNVSIMDEEERLRLLSYTVV